MDSLSKNLDKNYEEDLSKELENSCKVSKKSLDKKDETLPEILSTDIEKFNDILSDDGHCDIKKYKEHFLKYFEKNFKEYYNDFQEYFSDSDLESSSSEESDSESNEKINLHVNQIKKQNSYKTPNTLKIKRKSSKKESVSNTQEMKRN